MLWDNKMQEFSLYLENQAGEGSGSLSQYLIIQGRRDALQARGCSQGCTEMRGTKLDEVGTQPGFSFQTSC